MSYLLAVETEVQSGSLDFRTVKGATFGFAPRTLLFPALSAPSLVAPSCPYRGSSHVLTTEG